MSAETLNAPRSGYAWNLMFGIRDPFPVRIPCPVAPDGVTRQLVSVSFGGRSIRCRYEAYDDAPWFRRERLDEIAWDASSCSVGDVLEKCLHGIPKRHQSEVQRRILRMRCGRGHLVYFEPNMYWWHVLRKPCAGTRGTIWLISEGGTRGSLKLIDGGLYNAYDLESFWIGGVRDRPEFPIHTRKPHLPDYFGAWVLMVHRGNDRSRVVRVLQSDLMYSREAASEIAQRLPATCATGYRGELLELSKLLSQRRVLSSVGWTAEPVDGIPAYDLEEGD